MAYFGVEHQIFQIMNVEDQTTAIFKWEWWQRCQVFVLSQVIGRLFAPSQKLKK